MADKWFEEEGEGGKGRGIRGREEERGVAAKEKEGGEGKRKRHKAKPTLVSKNIEKTVYSSYTSMFNSMF